MGCEFRFKPAVQATECVARFRAFLADHIYGQFVILNKPHMRIVAPQCRKICGYTMFLGGRFPVNVSRQVP
jgi:hypothetical protein